ncbi:MAG: Uma2 family endonuclease [Blastocatellia bacterium]|nr:Uma2 family endonuclease [Blastocatellia bacterium]
MSLNPQTPLTFEEYLDAERRAGHRSEYFEGEVFAMAGASRQHNRIVTNLVTGLDNQLRERPCNVYSNDMRVRVEATGLSTYPDVVVTCEEELFYDQHQDTLLNPVVIIEVLSDSTEAYDRGKKFEHYQQIASLRQYTLVAQDKCRVEQYLRQENNRWIYTEAHDFDGALKLPSVGCELILKDIYAKVKLKSPGPPEDQNV